MRKRESFYKYCKDIFMRFNHAHGSLFAKGIAYSVILSTIPFIMLFIFISSIILKQNGELSRILLSYLGDIIPIESAQYLSERLLSYITIDSWSNMKIGGIIAMIFIPYSLLFSVERGLSSVMSNLSRRKLHHQIFFTLLFQTAIITTLFTSLYSFMFITTLEDYVTLPLFYRIYASDSFSIIMISMLLIVVYRMSYGAYLKRRILILVSISISIIWKFFNYFAATIITVSGKNELLYGIFAGGVVLMVWAYIFAMMLLIGGVVIAKETERSQNFIDIRN